MESDKTLAHAIIHSAKLEHPDLPLVECFIKDATDSDQAAKYLVRICTNDSKGVKFSQFVDDWKAIVKQCMYFLPPVLLRNV